jgi:hypothetical protein
MCMLFFVHKYNTYPVSYNDENWKLLNGRVIQNMIVEQFLLRTSFCNHVLEYYKFTMLAIIQNCFS